MMPSSHICHVPLISINPVQPFLGNEASKAAIIVRMGSDGHGESLFGCVRDKQPFAGNANALAPVCCVDLCRMRLKPRPVAYKSRVLCPSLLQLTGVGDLFHDNRGRLAN